MGRFDDIKTRLKHATAGPWVTRTKPHPLGGDSPAVEVVEDSPLYSPVATADARNADFIAHAREDVVLLVCALENLVAAYPCDTKPEDADAFLAASAALVELGIWEPQGLCPECEEVWVGEPCHPVKAPSQREAT